MAEQNAKDAGQRLFDALFQGPILGRFDEAVGRLSSRNDRAMRIKLQVDFDSPLLAEVNSLPWERLYRREGSLFLALDRRFGIVRHLRLPVSGGLAPVPGRLRLLVAAAMPTDCQLLDTETECREIAASWEHGSDLEVDFLNHATLDRLRERLLAKEYHGLHFIGHGDFDSLRGEGILLFENEQQESSSCSGQDLAIQLADRTSLRWVFLNACSTGITPILQPFSGLSAALLQVGIPAVLAMQKPMTDQVAIVFSRMVYRRLASGDSIDAAVSEGRLAIHRHMQGTLEWSIPVLFLRSMDEHLIPREAAQEAPLEIPADQTDAPETKSPNAPLSWKTLVRIVFPFVLILGLFLLDPLSPDERKAGSTAEKPVERAQLPEQKPLTPPPDPNHEEAPQPTTSTDEESAVATAPQSIVIREGQVVSIDALNAQASVRFSSKFGSSFARLTVAISGQPKTYEKTFMGPTTVDLVAGCTLQILSVNFEKREVVAVPVK
jgi:hypothetical protein